MLKSVKTGMKRKSDNEFMIIKNLKEIIDNDNFIDNIVDLEKTCFSSPLSKQQISEMIENLMTNIYIIINDFGLMVGYVVFYVIIDEIHIISIAVSPNERRKKYADELIKFVVDFARKNFIDVINLEVRINNIGAINLYKKNNFKIIAEHKDFYVKPVENAFFMQYKNNIKE